MATSHFLTLVFGSTLLAWLGVASYVLGGRAVHDLRERRLARARDRVSGRGLSRRALRHAAGGPSMSPQISLAFALEAGVSIGVERLVARAGSHRTERGKWRRIEALRILSLVDEPTALPLLEQALRADEDVASATASILGGLSSEMAARVLAAGIADSNVPASRLAAHLDSYARDVPQVALALAADASGERRYWGVSLLSRYVARMNVRRRLCAAALDPEPNVRAAVAEALGAASQDGLAELDALVRDEMWFVRAHAARALGARRCPGLGEGVATLLTDESWWVRAAAKDALTSLGAAAAAAVSPYLRSGDEFARNGAVEVLERIGHVDFVLSEAAAAPYDSRKRQAAQAIAYASETTYRTAVERAAPELRETLLGLVEPIEQAA